MMACHPAVKEQRVVMRGIHHLNVVDAKDRLPLQKSVNVSAAAAVVVVAAAAVAGVSWQLVVVVVKEVGLVNVHDEVDDDDHSHCFLLLVPCVGKKP
jgi:hypothetical protein